MIPELPDGIKNRTWTTKEVILIITVVVVGCIEYVKWSSYQNRLEKLEQQHAIDLKQVETELKNEIEKHENDRKESIKAIWQRIGAITQND
jgi:predicted negative regulator of RcsB-dependent stress response